jgi:hypothetical protein
MAKRPIIIEGNAEIELVSIYKIVKSRDFRAGYRDVLKGLPPPRFYDDWGYDRGRMVAVWLLATGQKPPKVSAVDGLAAAYYAASAAGALR